MRRRRYAGGDDSSEMLLDTVCNVFGAVILMTILVVIHTQTSVARIPPSAESVEQTIAIRKLRFRIDQLNRELASLADYEQLLRDEYDRNVTPTTDLVMQRRVEFVEALADVQDRITQARAGLGEQTQQRTQHEQDTDDVAEETAEVEQAIAEWVRRLADRQREVRPIASRLPVSHQSPAGEQLAYVIAGDRAYLMDDAAHCRREFIDYVRMRIEPIDGAGWAIEAGGSNQQFLQSLATGRPETHYVTFFTGIGDQSFEAVRVLRELAANRGFDFGYALYDLEEGLIVMPGKPNVE